MPRRYAVSFSAVGLVLLGMVAWGCSRPAQGPSAELGAHTRSTASLRVLAAGDVAGTLEPCGCVKDQLGGLDRFATAVLAARRTGSTLFVEAGSLLFPSSTIKADQREELSLRAQTLAKVMHSLDLLAWAPGKADFALGEPALLNLAQQSGIKLLKPAGVSDTSTSITIANLAGIRVGLVGVGSNSPTEPPRPEDLAAQLQKASKELDSQNAQLKIAVLNVPLGTVAKIASQVSAFQMVLVGGSSERALGADSDGSEPQLIGSTLVVEPPNHLRGLVTIDFTIIDGQLTFQDGTGVGRAAERVEIEHRISELTERVQVWKKQNQDKTQVAAREADLRRLQQRFAELAKPVAIPKTSYFMIQTVSIGSNQAGTTEVRAALDELGRRINLNNRDKFADRKAPPAAAGQASFVGVGNCETCHATQAKFWQTTHHASAYQTLVNKDRQFTLECVGCHVTGYEQPGGSTVTDVANLKNVQCENCHGPGSIHAKDQSVDSIIRKPDRQLCANRCHHSPHVAPSWTVDEAWPKILGEGHGKRHEWSE